MKKNYSNPKFKLVLLEPNDIVCDSIMEMGEGEGTKRTEAKQRGNNIWGEDE